MAANRKEKMTTQEMNAEDDVVAMNSLRRYDVLLGRSKTSAMHIGNVSFRAFIDSRLDAYTSAGSRSAKIHAVVALTNEVYKAGGRFLDPKGNNLWVQVDRSSARKKVGNSMRDALKLVNKGRARHLTVDLARDITEKTSFGDVVDHIYKSCNARFVKQQETNRFITPTKKDTTLSTNADSSKTENDKATNETKNVSGKEHDTTIKENADATASSEADRGKASEENKKEEILAKEAPKDSQITSRKLSAAACLPPATPALIEAFDESRHGYPLLQNEIRRTRIVDEGTTDLCTISSPSSAQE